MVAAAVAAIVGAVWLWAPDDLYVRMFVWLVPAVALAGAFVASRRRGATPLVVAAALATLLPQLNHLATPELANRAVGHYISAVRRPHERVCGIGQTQGLGPYAFSFTKVASPARLRRCDIAFVLMPHLTHARLIAAARSTFGFPCALPAHTTATVFSRRPLPHRAAPSGGRVARCSTPSRTVGALVRPPGGTAKISGRRSNPGDAAPGWPPQAPGQQLRPRPLRRRACRATVASAPSCTTDISRASMMAAMPLLTATGSMSVRTAPVTCSTRSRSAQAWRRSVSAGSSSTRSVTSGSSPARRPPRKSC